MENEKKLDRMKAMKLAKYLAPLIMKNLDVCDNDKPQYLLYVNSLEIQLYKAMQKALKL